MTAPGIARAAIGSAQPGPRAPAVEAAGGDEGGDGRSPTIQSERPASTSTAGGSFALSLVLPVTYGIELLRDVMLRDTAPGTTDLGGLVATTVVFGALAWSLLHRRLRTR